MAVDHNRVHAAHERLLTGDPTATAELFELLLRPLVDRLNSRWPTRTHTDETHDAAINVLVDYIAAPQRFDPARSTLLHWLGVQAHADLINDYRSTKKAFERDLILVDDVAKARSGRKRPGVTRKRPASYDDYPSERDSPFLRRVAAAFPDPADRGLIRLMSDGERSTVAAAEVLGVGDLPPKEQAFVVKRHKDRIMKKLRRMGDEL